VTPAELVARIIFRRLLLAPARASRARLVSSVRPIFAIICAKRGSSRTDPTSAPVNPAHQTVAVGQKRERFLKTAQRHQIQPRIKLRSAGAQRPPLRSLPLAHEARFAQHEDRLASASHGSQLAVRQTKRATSTASFFAPRPATPRDAPAARDEEVRVARRASERVAVASASHKRRADIAPRIKPDN